jgi:hypothetical protein
VENESAGAVGASSHRAGCSGPLVLQAELAQADMPGPLRSYPPPGRARAEGEGEMKLGPRSASRPWTPADEAQLLALLDSKMDRTLIARKLKRTVLAISNRRAILNKRRLAELRLKAKK